MKKEKKFETISVELVERFVQDYGNTDVVECFVVEVFDDDDKELISKMPIPTDLVEDFNEAIEYVKWSRNYGKEEVLYKVKIEKVIWQFGGFISEPIRR